VHRVLQANIPSHNTSSIAESNLPVTLLVPIDRCNGRLLHWTYWNQQCNRTHFRWSTSRKSWH